MHYLGQWVDVINECLPQPMNVCRRWMAGFKVDFGFTAEHKTEVIFRCIPITRVFRTVLQRIVRIVELPVSVSQLFVSKIDPKDALPLLPPATISYWGQVSRMTMTTHLIDPT